MFATLLFLAIGALIVFSLLMLFSVIAGGLTLGIVLLVLGVVLAIYAGNSGYTRRL